MKNHLKIDNKASVEPTSETYQEGYPKDNRGITFYKDGGEILVGAAILHHMIEVKQDGGLRLCVTIDDSDLLVESFTSRIKSESEAITLPMSVINRIDKDGNRKRVLIENFDVTIDYRECWFGVIYLTVDL